MVAGAGRGLGEQADHPQRDEVVHQLHAVAGADRADMGDVLGEAGQHRAGGLQNVAATAHQQVEAPLGGLLRRAGHGRIEKARAGGLHRRSHAGRGRRQGGGAVDHQAAGAQALEHATGTGQHLLDLRRAGEDQDHDVRARGERAPVGEALRPVGHQVLRGLVAGVLEEAQGVALADQVGGYATAHVADAEHADARRGHARIVADRRSIPPPAAGAYGAGVQGRGGLS